MATPDPTSRYAGLRTVTIPGPHGSAIVLGVPRVVPAPTTAGLYQVRPGDRLDLMAQAALGDTTRWWVLADANPWSDADRLETPGQTIELPHG
jgi:nucleoid-associated protein YgaU